MSVRCAMTTWHSEQISLGWYQLSKDKSMSVPMHKNSSSLG